MKKVLLTLIALTLFIVPARSFDLENSQLELQIQSIRSGGAESVNAYTTDDAQQEDVFTFGFDEEESIYEYDFKSPKKAFIYSLLIPGWGERYTKSSMFKTILFLGIEAGMWMGYFDFHNEGEKLTDEFEDYADDFWNEQYYQDWLVTNDIDEDTLTHSLPDSRTQQYYEMIGKYDQFRVGWEDYQENPNLYDSVPSPYRDEYNSDRQSANDKLDQANNFIIYSMLNHLLSAFDSALAAKRHNKQKSAEMWLSVKADMKKYSATESIPIIRLSYRF